MMAGMTIEEIQKRVADLGGHDSEIAHINEDEIHQDVLRAIASGEYTKEAMMEMAKAALKTLENQDFDRWYA